MVCFLSWAGLAQAQDREFKPFKVDLALGYAIPGGKGSSAGIVFAVEPKYALMDQLSVGLRFEGAVVARGFESATSSTSGSSVSLSVSAIRSFVLTGDYYFSTNKSRFFGGLGAGLFQYASAGAAFTTSGNTAVGSSGDVSEYNKFGVVPRIGAELGHFRLGLEYNLVPKHEVDKITFTNSYLSFKIGAFIGGGQY